MQVMKHCHVVKQAKQVPSVQLSCIIKCPIATFCSVGNGHIMSVVSGWVAQVWIFMKLLGTGSTHFKYSVLQYEQGVTVACILDANYLLGPVNWVTIKKRLKHAVGRSLMWESHIYKSCKTENIIDLSLMLKFCIDINGIYFVKCT